MGFTVIRPDIVEGCIASPFDMCVTHLMWQGPAFTEARAAMSLIARQGKVGPHPDSPLYFAYPWATLIDQGCLERAVQDFSTWTASMDIPVGRPIHTVCQHIHWSRALPVMKEMGITDVHLSHLTIKAKELARLSGIEAHSFPLVAAAFCDPMTLQMHTHVPSPLTGRTWLCGFSGAHMPHYRSQIRLRLKDSFPVTVGDDYYFNLAPKWFYNDLVYTYQAQSKAIPIEGAQTVFLGQAEYRERLAQTIFSLCPEGAGPNTLRFWESLQAGCIPVIFENDWIPPIIPGIEFKTFTVLIKNFEVDRTHEILRELWGKSSEVVQEMQRNVLAVAKACRDLLVFESQGGGTC